MKQRAILGALATASLIAAAPAFAQSPAASGTDRQVTTETRNDGRDWGWIGLLGLIGLAGLKGRKHDDDYRRNNVPGRA